MLDATSGDSLRLSRKRRFPSLILSSKVKPWGAEMSPQTSLRRAKVEAFVIGNDEAGRALDDACELQTIRTKEL